MEEKHFHTNALQMYYNCNIISLLCDEMENEHMASTIQVRVDDELKIKSDNLFKDLGTDTTTAIRIFLTQAVANNGFPFEIKRVKADPYETLSEEELLMKLETSRQHAKQGKYRDADEVIGDMRAKYGI